MEDDAIVRKFVSKTLESAGYEAISASDGLEARQLFERYASGLALMVAEVALPPVGGTHFIQTLPTLAPRVPVVFTSCLGDSEVSEELPGPVLQKPFRAADLRRAVRDHALGGAMPIPTSGASE